MYNGENEIKCPEDKYIKHFLWSDYFHDSEIENIQFSNSRGKENYSPDQVVLTIKSIRDMDCDWIRIKGTRDEKKAFLIENKQKYIYNLYFTDCKYFNYEKSILANEYINGRFKDSAILNKITKSTAKPYYHFRIGTDDGYIDIIFSKFKIEKLVGRIRVNDINVVDYAVIWLQKFNNGTLINEKGELSIIRLLEMAGNGDDVERYNALHYLLHYTTESLVDIARNIIKLNNEEYEMSKTVAISILGIQGEEKDLPLLLDEYFAIEEKYTKESICYCSTLLPRRHVMDAIEKIKYRNDTKYKILL